MYDVRSGGSLASALEASMDGSAAVAPSIALVTINFAPEVTGIGVYSTGLADYLGERGYKVVVHTAFPYYPHWRKRAEDRGKLFRREWRGRVRVRRTYLFVPQRPSALKRIFHELSFALTAAMSYLASPRADVTIVVSPPLCLGLLVLGLARLRGSRTILHVHDLQPDAAVECGLLREGLFTRVLYRMEKIIYRLADVVGSIGVGMLDRIREKGVPARKLLLIPNWANEDLVRPLPPQTKYRSAWGLDGCFVVLYSGNMGVKQGLTSLLDAAQLLRDRSDVRFVLVGDGAEKTKLQAYVEQLGLQNVQFQPLQPTEDLSELLATADVSVVPQKRGVTDIFMPCKVANLMCSARPLVVASSRATELSRVIVRAQCGVIVPPEDAQALADALVALYEDPQGRARLGERGRAYAEQELSASRVLSGFERWLQGWLSRDSIAGRVAAER